MKAKFTQERNPATGMYLHFSLVLELRELLSRFVGSDLEHDRSGSISYNDATRIAQCGNHEKDDE